MTAAEENYFLNIFDKINHFRLTNHLCDVVLSTDCQEIRAHSLILSAGSDYFYKYFKNNQDLEQNLLGNVVLNFKGIDVAMVKGLLEYIYTGNLLVDKLEDIDKLFVYLKQFGTTVMNRKCLNVNIKSTSFGTVLESYVIFNNYNHTSFDGCVDDKNKIVKQEFTEYVYKIFSTIDEYRRSNYLIDSKFVCGNIKVPCHALIACAVSKYLNNNIFKETSTNSIYTDHIQMGITGEQINSVEYVFDFSLFPLYAVKLVIHYMYTGKLLLRQHLSVEEWSDLYVALVDLKTDVEKRIENPKDNFVTFVNEKDEGLATLNTDFYSDTYSNHQDNSCSSSTHDPLINKTFSDRPNNKGEKLISSKNSFKCPYCDKAFFYKSQYENHLRSHTGFKPFQCGLCLKSFSFNLNLKQHMKTHTGEKPHECGVCHKKFTQKGHLKSHMRKHTGERPFVCSLCPKNYKNRLDLRLHCLKIHNLNIKVRNSNIKI